MIERNLLDDGVFGEVFVPVLFGGAKKATKYISPRLVVKATLHGKKIDRRCGQVHIVLTYGSPNFAERKFIRQCRRVGEPFPVKKVQLKPIHKEAV